MEVCCISYLLYLLHLTQDLLITRYFGSVLEIVKSGLIILSRNPRFSFRCGSLSSLSGMEKIGTVVVQAYNPSSCELRQKNVQCVSGQFELQFELKVSLVVQWYTTCLAGSRL